MLVQASFESANNALELTLKLFVIFPSLSLSLLLLIVAKLLGEK